MTKKGPGGLASASRACTQCRVVFLVGFMGAGKTSVGKLLAERLGWTFEDLDDRIEQREARTVDQIFAESGEASFREIEHQCLREFLTGPDSPPRVLALGGGAFAQPRNAVLMAHPGLLSIFLDGPPEELYRRCELQSSSRPLRRNLDEFRKLYETRRRYYMAASLRIDTGGKGMDAVATEIVARLRERDSVKTLEGVSG